MEVNERLCDKNDPVSNNYKHIDVCSQNTSDLLRRRSLRWLGVSHEIRKFF